LAATWCDPGAPARPDCQSNRPATAAAATTTAAKIARGRRGRAICGASRVIRGCGWVAEGAGLASGGVGGAAAVADWASGGVGWASGGGGGGGVGGGGVGGGDCAAALACAFTMAGRPASAAAPSPWVIVIGAGACSTTAATVG